MPAAIPCPSCGSSVEREFCPACGERRMHADDLSAQRFATQTFEGITNLDGKLPRSAWLLLARPGFLTREFIRGVRSRYVRPVALFLLANAAYYLLQPLTGINTFRTTLALHSRQMYSALAGRMVEAEIAARGGDAAGYAAQFDARIDSLSKLLLFAFVPALATVFALIAFDRRRRFGEHVVLALHFMAFVLSYLCLLAMPLQALIASRFLPVGMRGDGLPSLITLLLITVYLALAFRRVLEDSLARALGRALLASAAFAILLMLYRAALFFVTFWTT